MEVLKALNISKSFDGKEVVKNVSLTLNKGELVSILGVSGSGKTTIFNILSGVLMPDSGSVSLNGEDITGSVGKISYMQQKDLLLPFLDIADNASIPLRLSGVSKKEARERAISHFSEFGLLGNEKKYPSQLSGGMRQRAALLRAYLYTDEVMLLDEPFSALDAITKEKLHGWFKGVQKSHGSSAFLITHDVSEAILLSDRIYILSNDPGEITAQFKIEWDGARDNSFALSEQFLRYKTEIINAIENE